MSATKETGTRNTTSSAETSLAKNSFDGATRLRGGSSEQKPQEQKPTTSQGK
jgi:hypothetical protein